MTTSMDCILPVSLATHAHVRGLQAIAAARHALQPERAEKLHNVLVALAGLQELGPMSVYMWYVRLNKCMYL